MNVVSDIKVRLIFLQIRLRRRLGGEVQDQVQEGVQARPEAEVRPHLHPQVQSHHGGEGAGQADGAGGQEASAVFKRFVYFMTSLVQKQADPLLNIFR